MTHTTTTPQVSMLREALEFAAATIELFDDATMQADHMLDSGECAAVIRALIDSPRIQALATENAAIQPAGEAKAVAWAAFADNGNIRIWTSVADDVRKLAESNGLELVPLYATPPASPVQAKAEQVAIAFDSTAECSPLLTMCPRCKNPHNACDQVFAATEANSEASELPPLPPFPAGDRFKDVKLFRALGSGSGSVLYECWDDAITAYALAYGQLCRDTARQPVAAPSDRDAALAEVIALLASKRKTIESDLAYWGDSSGRTASILTALASLTDEIRALKRKSAAPVAQGEALTDWLLPDDLAALERFHECCMDFDSGGHDVSKPKMSRLVEIGVVRSSGFGRHMVTTFGDYVLRRDEVVSRDLPLKTYAEYCEDSRIESERAILAKRTGSADHD